MSGTSHPYQWPRSPGPLPGEHDFDPYGGNLDCQHAFEIFGGMTLDQAYLEFTEIPEVYQEDFMFMGPGAFIYYFPVIDRYLREVTSDCEFDDCEADILGKTVDSQLDHDSVKRSKKVIFEIRLLTEFVLESASRFSGSDKIRKEIRSSWSQVSEKLADPEKPNGL